MSDGFLFWYESDWTPQRARERVGRLDAAGLSLAYPGTGRITAISPEGEQTPVDRPTLLRRAAVDAAAAFSFQYWLDVDIDVFCTVERLAPDLVVQRLYLDGLTMRQTLLVIRIVQEEVRAAAGSTRGLIVDRTGGSVDKDWDAVIAIGDLVVFDPEGLLPAD
ncbi:MAG TPA: hypothetical protein VHZ97_05315 [Pseudonocardiaceae bacterium]|jgi:hypothetical protein|nr:hypothetical protein [Pseudonocardiaceae bacterium]